MQNHYWEKDNRSGRHSQAAGDAKHCSGRCSQAAGDAKPKDCAANEERLY